MPDLAGGIDWSPKRKDEPPKAVTDLAAVVAQLTTAVQGLQAAPAVPARPPEPRKKPLWEPEGPGFVPAAPLPEAKPSSFSAANMQLIQSQAIAFKLRGLDRSVGDFLRFGGDPRPVFAKYRELLGDIDSFIARYAQSPEGAPLRAAADLLRNALNAASPA